MDYKSFAVSDIDNDVYNQGLEVAQSLAYKKEKIRLMCDAHRGASGPVGFTSTFTDMIVPQTCGVDIACRVSAFSLPLTKDNCDEEFLAKFDEVIHTVVPSGFSVRQSEHSLSESFPYEELRCWNELKNQDRLRKSMGTLGGGRLDCLRAA